MTLSPILRERAKWTRIAAQLDRELGPVTFQGLPMADGESVSEWRVRNQSAIEAHLAGRRGLAFIVCAAHSTPDYSVCTLDCGNTARDCERCFAEEEYG
jgi:hypothetical protein